MAVSALRLVALFAVLGHPVDFLPAAVLTTAAGVSPGGLGLREVFTPAVASLLGVAPALAIRVSALNRVGDLGTVSLLAVLHQAVVPEAEPACR